MAKCDRSQCPEQLPAGSSFQNRDNRDNQKFCYNNQMAGLDRHKIRLLPCTDTQRFSKSTMISYGQSDQSVQSTDIRVSHPFPRVHTSCKEGKAHSSVTLNSSSPILR